LKSVSKIKEIWSSVWKKDSRYLRVVLQVAEKGSARVTKDLAGRTTLILSYEGYDLWCTVTKSDIYVVSLATSQSLVATWFWWERVFVKVMAQLRVREDLKPFFLSLEM